MPLHRHVATQVGELHLDQLLGVQRTVPISARIRDIVTLMTFLLASSLKLEGFELIGPRLFVF